jgi:hypothetical protein
MYHDRTACRAFLWAKNMEAKDIHKQMLPIWAAFVCGGAIEGKNELLTEKYTKVPIFPPQFTTWTCLGLNTGLRFHTPKTDRLSHENSFKTVNKISSG